MTSIVGSAQEKDAVTGLEMQTAKANTIERGAGARLMSEKSSAECAWPWGESPEEGS